MSGASSASARTGSRVAASRGLGVALLALAILTALAYQRVPSLDFVNIDDDRYVTDNPVVRQGLTAAGVRWALASTENFNWHPLTWVSHMTDVSLFGVNPAGHHAVSALIHTANGLLLLLALHALTGSLWRSAAVATLFALHPLHVESVAWVSERKDVLSTFFWFLSLVAYRFHARRPGAGRMLLVLAPFVLGLAAKPMLVTLPLTLLLLDYWPLNRLGGTAAPAGIRSLFSRRAGVLWLEKLPLFLVAALSGAVTLYAQSLGGATRTMETFPLAVRAANATVSVAAYLSRAVLPRGLAVYYPFRENIPSLTLLAATLLVLGVTAAALRARSSPAFSTGWFWYLATLLPVIGIVQVGGQAMADRYTYVPLLGIFIAAVWDAGRPPRGRLTVALRAFAAAAVAAALLVATRRQVATWRTSEELYRHALSVTTGNWFAEFNYAEALSRAGRTDEAVEHYRLALAAHPFLAQAHTNLGSLLARQGKSLEALDHFRRAVEADPESSQAQMNLGLTLERLGRQREAAVHFRAATAGAGSR